jgi:hypothetical protein
MSAELAVVLVLHAVAIAMFATNKPRMNAVALIMLTALFFTGVIARGVARLLPDRLTSTGHEVLTVGEAPPASVTRTSCSSRPCSSSATA